MSPSFLLVKNCSSESNSSFLEERGHSMGKSKEKELTQNEKEFIPQENSKMLKFIEFK